MNAGSNPYATSGSDLNDSPEPAPSGGTRWWHVLLTCLMFIALPLYLLIAVMCVFEVFKTGGRAQVQFALNIPLCLVSAYLCWLAIQRLANAGRGAALLTLVALVGMVLLREGWIINRLLRFVGV